MKIVTIIGARPQFIKAVVISLNLRKTAGVQEVVVHTGQHYDDNMSRVFFNELKIPKPKYNLGVGSGSHGWQTAVMLQEIEKVLIKEKPDRVLVYGDTNSTLAGTLAAAKLHIPVAHVEAGLRSFNKKMPEEINRVLTDHISDILFAPTKLAVDNLLMEGINKNKIFKIGDVMYDAAIYYGKKAEVASRILDRLCVFPKNYVLSTVHRAENTDNLKRLTRIIGGLKRVALDIPVILPLHPRTKHYAKVGKINFGKIKVIEPLGYFDILKLEKNAKLIATDSGGVQKEAFFYKVPCVTLREETEWRESVELGWNIVLNKSDWKNIRDAIFSRLDTEGEKRFPYGDGKAALKIAKLLSRIKL